MTSQIPTNACTTLPPPRALPASLVAAIDGLRALGASIEAWLAARARAGADRDALARMSERELKDIGLYRGNLDSARDAVELQERWH